MTPAQPPVSKSDKACCIPRERLSVYRRQRLRVYARSQLSVYARQRLRVYARSQLSGLLAAAR